MTRISPSVFQLPIDKMRKGWYADQYFNHTKNLVSKMPNGGPNVVMQCFQRKDSVLGGIDEAIAILKLCSGEMYYPEWASNLTFAQVQSLNDAYGEWRDGWNQLKVTALNEGDAIVPWEPVLQIEGPYRLFAHLETTYLGVMARRSLVMRNVKEVVAAANDKPIWFFPARHDHWVVQTGDGLAAHAAGAASVSTDAGASWWGGNGMGTIPHSLIAAFGGDTVKAARAFAAEYKDQMNVTVLVDFENDSVDTAVRVADALKDDLWGVRLDTSGNMTDISLLRHPEYGSFKSTGVVPELVHEVRRTLDNLDHPNVKIVVSGGFTADKIREFEAASVPVDAYGVGSSLLRGSNDFTADIVRVDGKDCSKIGRHFRDDSRLEVVT